MQATARIAFRKAKSRRTIDNKSPVKLCVTHKNERRYYSITDRIKDHKWLFLSDEEIEKVIVNNPRGKYKDISAEYSRIITEAENIIKGFQTFSFGQFEEKYMGKAGDWDNVFSAIWAHIQDLETENRLGYASSFESTLRAIKESHTGKKFKYNTRRDKVKTRKNDYLTGTPLLFYDITPSWLTRFEHWLQKQGKSRSTIGIYLRNIRVMFNLAIKIHKVKAEYPFDAYQIKSAIGRKIALTTHEIALIAGYKTENPQEQFYGNLFMFSFYAAGMNCSDIARLKYSDIHNGEIEFVRQKTKREETTEEKQHIPITGTMKRIIEKHGVRAVGHDSYIFPILKPEWTEQQKYNAIRQFTKTLNVYIRRISSKIGISEKISSYSARHSWATISKNSGKSTEFISEMLGHSDVRVTQRYLKSFEKSTRVEAAEEMEKLIKTSAS